MTPARSRTCATPERLRQTTVTLRPRRERIAASRTTRGADDMAPAVTMQTAPCKRSLLAGLTEPASPEGLPFEPSPPSPGPSPSAMTMACSVLAGRDGGVRRGQHPLVEVKIAIDHMI